MQFYGYINAKTVSWKVSCIADLNENKDRFSSHSSLQIWVSANLTFLKIFFMYFDSNFIQVDQSFIYSLKHTYFMIH